MHLVLMRLTTTASNIVALRMLEPPRRDQAGHDQDSNTLQVSIVSRIWMIEREVYAYVNCIVLAGVAFITCTMLIMRTPCIPQS